MRLDHRYRRLRRTPVIRDMLTETHVSTNHLVLPVFVQDIDRSKTAIDTLPGVYRYGIEDVFTVCENAMSLGVHAIALFPIIEDHLKDNMASESLNPDGFLPRLIRNIKSRFPSLLVVADVALDPFSSDGHDGIVKDGEVVNDETVDKLARMSVLLAKAGADFVAPSDMMDGRVYAIRQALDNEGLINTGILSYSVKFASVFYGPFRDALQSEPKEGDKKTYQLNPANVRESLKEAIQDEHEAADILMVKPAGFYLDVLSTLKEQTHLPLAAYQVSGEYAMLKFAAKHGCFDFDQALFESILAIRRAGADMIFTYGALELATYLRSL